MKTERKANLLFQIMTSIWNILKIINIKSITPVHRVHDCSPLSPFNIWVKLYRFLSERKRNRNYSILSSLPQFLFYANTLPFCKFKWKKHRNDHISTPLTHYTYSEQMSYTHLNFFSFGEKEHKPFIQLAS